MQAALNTDLPFVDMTAHMRPMVEKVHYPMAGITIDMSRAAADDPAVGWLADRVHPSTLPSARSASILYALSGAKNARPG